MMRKKHDKWRRVHECQTFGEIKRKENRLNSNDERNIMMNKTS
jgi:hypothetical protein